MRANSVPPRRRLAFRIGGPLLALTLAVAACAPAGPPGETVDSPCDLNAGPCAVALGRGRTLTLAITPRPIPLMAPLSINARIDGAATPGATLDFVGEAMDMGLNRRALTDGGDGTLRGSGVLPVCVTGAMDWRAELTLKWPDGPQAVRFRFRSP